MRSALLTPARVAVIALLLAVAAGCGGSNSPSTGSPEAVESSQAPVYELDDRESFLAAGPTCEELTGWYDQFPADTDVEMAVARVSACGTLPKAFTDDPERVGVSELLLEALLGEGDVPVDPAARETALSLLATFACDDFADNSKSLFQVAQNILDAGGTVKDYPTVIKLAKRECPSYAEELDMFDTKDPIRAASQLRRYIEGAYTVSSAEDSEYAALAGVTCNYLRRGDSLSSASMLFEYLPIERGHGSTIGRRAAELFCASLL